jgi:LysR family transcriptional regulator, cyn operon transcriptional activator
LNDIPTLLDLVKTGDFSTILSRATVEGVSGLKTVPISGKDMMRQAWLIRLGTSYEKQAAKVFAGMLLGGKNDV